MRLTSRAGGARRTLDVFAACVAAAAVAAAAVESARGAAAPAPPVVLLQGRAAADAAYARMVNGTLMVPARLFEALEVRIGWDAGTRAAVLRREPHAVRLAVGNRDALADGKRLVLPEAPSLVEGRLMVPLRAVAEALGFEVKWDGKRNRVDVVSPPPATSPPKPAASPAPPASDGPVQRSGQAEATGAGHPMRPYVPSPRPDPPAMDSPADELLAVLPALLPQGRLPDDALFREVARASRGPAASTPAPPAAAPVTSSVVAPPPPAPPPVTAPPPAPAPAASPSTASDRQPATAPASTSEPARVAEPPAPAPPPAAKPERQSAPSASAVAPAAPAPAAPGSSAARASAPAPAPARLTELTPAERVEQPAAQGTEELVEVTGVTVRREGGRARIDVLGDGPLRLRSDPVVLSDPPRLVMDLAGARLGEAGVDYPADGELVRGIRLAQYAPGVVRVAVDLAAAVGFRVEQDAEDGRLSVLLNHAVSAVYWVWGGDGRGQLWIEMSGMAAVRTAVLEQPLRMLVDIQQATLVGSPGEWEVSSGPVGRFRVSQFQPDVVRVVLELQKPIRPRVLSSLDLTLALLDPEAGRSRPPAASGDVDVVLDVYSRITSVTVRPMGPQSAAVVVQATAPIEPRTFYLRNPGRLVLDLPGAVIDPSLSQDKLEFRSSTGPALSVRVGQFLPRSARVVVDLRQPVGYRVFEADENQTLVLALGDRPLTGHTVAIDPGHGGLDPGAIGVSGTPEKAYNLDIAQRLAKRLESVGIEVTMTRRTDTFVDLDERVQMAVRAGADVFVSVHNNASTSGKGEGTEVFYSPNHRASQRLAELLYDALVDKLSPSGRGVRLRRDLRVLRLAPMPAALVEVAFVDNPEEERRLRDPDFREAAAEAMFGAIVSFLSELGDNTAGAPRARALQ